MDKTDLLKDIYENKHIKKKKWCPHRWLIKLTCRKFMVWSVSQAFIFIVLLRNGFSQDYKYINTLAIGSIIISVCYFLAESIDSIADKLVERTTLSIALGR